MHPVIGITCALQKPDGTGPVPTSLTPNYYVNSDYCTAVEEVGAIPVLVPMVQNKTVIAKMLKNLDAIIFSGGGNALPKEVTEQPYLPSLAEQNPERYRFDSYLIQQVLDLDMPMIGICRGHQMINEVMGGTIYSKIQTEIPGAKSHHQGDVSGAKAWHAIDITEESKLSHILGENNIEVNSFHNQSVFKEGKGLKIVARAPDGVVEAIESREHSFVFGVQFHPEKMRDEAFSQRFFTAFREAANNYRDSKEPNR
ncbi:MAG: gamma-glutamyl-gamma-aminobutyrate hydrolase family protein [Firmicutes bacterium]|mgnify:CR=1 FL=1|nr:gamma-glutamyl-gamma-aminobutyrate hydrolase family protein [Bacillota bacterium]